MLGSVNVTGDLIVFALGCEATGKVSCAMSEEDDAVASTTNGVSRRTVTRAIAWSVPTIAVGMTVPLAAASPPPVPPPPVFSWANGCATTGSGSGCADQKKTAQVPFTISNPTAETLQFQVVGSKSWNTNDSEPPNFSPPFGIYTNNGTQNACNPVVGAAGCDGYVSVTLGPGGSANLWLVGNELGNSSAFWMKVQYRWVRPGTCAVVVPTATATADVISSPNNCA